MIERPDIETLMAGPLGTWLQEQAIVRDEAREKSNWRFVIFACIALPVLAFIWFIPFLGDFRLFITGAAAIGGSVWAYSPRAKAKKETKVGINEALASALGLTYSHDLKPGAGYERGKQYKMFRHHNRQSFEDLWTGEIGGHAFTLHEAKLVHESGSGKNRRRVTVYQGPVITLGCTRRFHGTTLLERAGKHQKFLFFGEKDTLNMDGSSLDKIDMVHPEFDDEFTVYSTDPVEAKYLVHPTYVEKLIEVERAFAGNKVRALFHDGELTVLLETKNMFESGSLDASRDREMVEKCVNQFMSMAVLVTTLNEQRS